MISLSILALLLSVIPVNNADTNKSVAFPRGVADSAGRAAYMATASGGIEAIDLASGRSLWAADVAARPLLLVNDRLAA